MWNWTEWAELLMQVDKLALAALLGGAIGFEREYHGQAAGLRTNLLVAMGACLMMMLSLEIEGLYANVNSNSAVRIDPARIASYAIASMGFLGAGAIIKGKGSVRGLTTAASLWLVTGIGLSVGAELIFPAVFTTLISLLVLYSLRRFKPVLPHHVYTSLTLRCSSTFKPLDQIREVLQDYPELEVKFTNYRHSVLDETVDYKFRLYSREQLPRGKIVGRLLEVVGLYEISWEEGEVP